MSSMVGAAVLGSSRLFLGGDVPRQQLHHQQQQQQQQHHHIPAVKHPTGLKVARGTAPLEDAHQVCSLFVILPMMLWTGAKRVRGTVQPSDTCPQWCNCIGRRRPWVTVEVTDGPETRNSLSNGTSIAGDGEFAPLAGSIPQFLPPTSTDVQVGICREQGYSLWLISCAGRPVVSHHLTREFDESCVSLCWFESIALAM